MAVLLPAPPSITAREGSVQESGGALAPPVAAGWILAIMEAALVPHATNSTKRVNIRTELANLIEALNTNEVPYALCGGFAVIVHGYVRATKDVDILINEADLDAVKTIVGALGYNVPGGLLRFKPDTPAETRVFRLSKFEGPDFLTLDLILVTAVLESAWASRECRADGPRTLWVVSLEGLRTMKRLAAREQDLADLAMLQKITQSADDGE